MNSFDSLLLLDGHTSILWRQQPSLFVVTLIRKKDLVFCTWCHRQIDQWKPEDKPMEYHNTICFFRNNKAGNVGLEDDPADAPELSNK